MPKRLDDDTTMPSEDLTGQRFGRLTVIAFAGRRPLSTGKMVMRYDQMRDEGKEEVSKDVRY